MTIYNNPGCAIFQGGLIRQIYPNGSFVRGFYGFRDKLHSPQPIINRWEVVLVRIQRVAVDVFADGLNCPAINGGKGFQVSFEKHPATKSTCWSRAAAMRWTQPIKAPWPPPTIPIRNLRFHDSMIRHPPYQIPCSLLTNHSQY